MLQLLSRLVAFNEPVAITTASVVIFTIVCIGWLTQAITEHVDLKSAFLTCPIPAKALAYAVVWAVVIACSGEQPKPFIYFEF
jgi:hypothetical protein